ncbi:polysaccharide deacetylase family protein [Alkalimarinus sediminis]|uniref:Polysaccharide deacetylase family protein n=1 Tax=Alkalimarinus sediminis TaxID=1632866 RepID=A0A9E8HK56_9ALTE|nr:polysaccharide deacetylase family protein [Alkalimarinus sediminis]UZW76153.1 polysaccharide deacetylase family protein [Alkalimarinus sediminis]
MTVKNIAYAIGKALGGVKVLKYLARNHPRILMYHRIRATAEGDGIHVDVFRQQMEILARDFNVVSLEELLHLANNNQPLPQHAVVITFDDGYEDFYLNAFPVLQALSLPTTVFVTTGFVSNETWLWPDKIKYMLSESQIGTLFVPELNTTFTLKTDKLRAWHSIADYCLTIPNKQKNPFINDLAIKLSVTLPFSAPDMYKALSWDQVKEMSANGIDIGSHSVTHPVMTKLELTDLRDELENSKRIIEQMLNKPVTGFCFPNGLSEDINEEVQGEINRAGYQYALAAFPTLNPLAERLAIGRYPAHPDISEFEKIVYGFRLQRLSN